MNNLMNVSIIFNVFFIVPTFVTILLETDSPLDVKDLMEIYFGYNKAVIDFTSDFLHRRSQSIREKHSLKAQKDDLSSAQASWMHPKRK